MIYVDPAPAQLASGEAYNRIGAEYYLSPAKLQSDYSPVRFERELRLLRRYRTGGAILDVGCSTGGFLYQLERLFPRAYRRLGMDASGPALDYAASQRVPVAHGDFLEYGFQPASFDIVTFWAVLEHVSRPDAFLGRAVSLLRPGGLCIVLVPNMRSLATRLLRARYRYIYPQHLNYFTRATLGRLGAKHFQILRLDSMHFNPLVIWQDARHGPREVSNPARAELLKRTTAYKQQPLLKPLRLMYQAAERVLSALNLADNLVAVLQHP